MIFPSIRHSQVVLDSQENLYPMTVSLKILIISSLFPAKTEEIKQKPFLTATPQKIKSATCPLISGSQRFSPCNSFLVHFGFKVMMRQPGSPKHVSRAIPGSMGRRLLIARNGKELRVRQIRRGIRDQNRKSENDLHDIPTSRHSCREAHLF